MRKFSFLILLCLILALFSCGKATEAPPTYIKEGERITIRSLEEWYKFNFDGSYTDNCKNFLTMIINGTSAFSEFESVKLSEFEIIRDEKAYGYDLAFNFTVTESNLDSLPIGSYNTIVKDSIDCYIIFNDASPLSINEGIRYSSSASNAINDWLNSTYSWSVPEKENLTGAMQLRCLNYFINRYSDGKKIANYKFKELVNEKLNAEINEDFFSELFVVENRELYIKKNPINGNTSFSIVSENTNDGITTVIVQFFADCNKFIKSDVVEYKVGNKDQILGCERILVSEYPPYGVTNEFGEPW